MININCSFQKFNDLMGIHKVIFDSLIDGKPLVESVKDVKSKYLQHYYGQDLSGLGSDPESIKNTLSDVASAIYMATKIAEEANNLEANSSKYDMTGAEQVINDLVGQWQAQILENFGTRALVNVEGRSTQEEIDSTATSGDIEPSFEQDKFVNSNIIAEPLNTSVRTIKTPTDLTYNYFKAATLAKNKLTRTIFNDLFKASFIDLSDPTATPVKTGKEVDLNVKNYKSKLFSTLYPNDALYIDGITRPDLQEKLNQFENALQEMNGGNGVYVQDLFRWTILDSNELKQYNAFITLKHFDDLIRMYASGFVKVKTNLIGNYSETLDDAKYLPANLSRMRTAWNENEIVNIAQETTAIFRTFIETTPIINLEGYRTGNFLKPDQVYYSLSKLKSKIDKSDVTNSVKNAMVDAIEKYFNGTSKELNKSDVKTLLSLYQRVYMDQNINRKWRSIPTLSSVISNIEAIRENSLFMVYKSHFPGKHDINLLEVISSSINKVDLMNYSELSYDFTTKEFRSLGLQNKLNDKNFNVIKALGSQSLVATPQSVQKWRDNLNLDVDDESVTFNFGSTQVRYDVLNGEFLDRNGDLFDFGSISIPLNIIDLNIDSMADNYPEYKTLLDTVSNITGQPLTSLNYEIPQIMSDNYGNSHVKDLLAIAGNFVYTSHLKAEYLEDLSNMSASDIKGALDRVYGLTGKFPFKKLWNARAGYFNLDFGDLAFQAIRNYADVLNEVYGSNIKSTTLNAQGNSIPTYTLSRMINDFDNVLHLARNSPYLTEMPLANNMFVRDTENNLLKRIEVRLNLKDAKGNIISSAGLSDIETVTYDILNDYVEQKIQPNEVDQNVKFQPTNFADKSSHAAIVINGNAYLEIDGQRKRYREFKAEDFKNHFYATQGDYFTKAWKTLEKDYKTLFESGALHKRYLANNPTLKTVFGTGIQLEGLIDYNIIDDYYKGDKLEQAVKTYNSLFNTTEDFLLKGAGAQDLTIEDVNNIIGKVTEKTLLEAMNDAGIDTVKTFSYELDDKKRPVINRSLKYLLDNFTTNKTSHERKLAVKFLKSLEDMGFSLDYLNPNTLAENSLLMRAAEKWDLKKFKDTKLGRYNLYTGSLSGKFTMNPMLEQYFWEYNMNTQNFQNATVGSVLGHPSKVKRGKNETEEAFQDKMISARTIAMFKRMVIHQATFHPYNLNLVNGIPFYNKVAYIKDPSSDVFSPYGLTAGVDVTDGSTYNLPLLTILQNNSLLDQSAGWTQKSIGGGINFKYNTAELLKHAAHSITNERLNNENEDAKYSWMNLVRKGLNQPFAINGIPVKLDISKDFNGREINLEDSFPDVAFYDPALRQYLSVQKIEPSANWLNSNEYNVFYKDLETGETLDPRAFSINNLYDLWQLLGGKNSISYVEGEYDALANRPEHLKSYIPSNRSWEALAEYVNRVGVWYNDQDISKMIIDRDTITPLDIKEAYNTRIMSPEATTKNFTSATMSPSQKTVIQPLKQSFIGQFTFSSGQKVGVQNENDTTVIFKGNDTPLKYNANVSNMHTGLQLNSDHEYDNSSVTEPTQITNTLPFNGDTPEYANKAYKAIYTYIDNSLSKVLPDVDKMLVSPDAKYRIYNILVNEIVKGLEGKDLTNMAGAITSTVKKELDRYKQELKQIVQASPADTVYSTALQKLETLGDEGFKLPFSDSNIYSSFATTVANFFTKNGIRRKLPGTSMVISPYSGFAGVRQVIDPSTGLEQVVMESGYNDWKSQIISNGEMPDMYETTPVTLENKDSVEMFDTVINSEGKKIQLSSPNAYYAFKADSSEYTKLNTASRDLKPTLHKWQIEGNQGFTNYYDLPVSKLSFVNSQVVSAYQNLLSIAGNKLSGRITDSGRSQYEIETEGSLVDNLEKAAQKLQGLIVEHNNLIMQSGLEADIPLISLNVTMFNDRYNIVPSISNFEFSDNIKNLLKNELTQNLYDVYTNKRAPLPVTSLNIVGALSKYNILTDWENPSLTRNAQEAYEEYLIENPDATVSQWYIDVRPMVRVDNLTTIPGEILMPPIFKTKYGINANTNVSDINAKFFHDNLNSNALPHTLSHDFYVRSLNGEHLYVLVEGSENYHKLDLRPVDVDSVTVRQKDGTDKTFKIDEDGNSQYELGYSKLYQSMIDGKMHNFVVVKGIDDLKGLDVITKGNNSPYKDIIPNFQSGMAVANLAVQYYDFSDPKFGKKFGKILKSLNSLINKTNKLIDANNRVDEVAKPVTDEVLLTLYDKEWITEQIASINKRIQQLSVDSKNDPTDELGRAKDKLVYLQAYDQALDSNDTETILKQALIFRNRENNRTADKINSLVTSLSKGQSDIDNALKSLTTFVQNNIVDRNARYAQDMYSSFRVQLNVTASRIPGQHMQSYMGQTIVGFVHSEENLGFVSPFHMWITGEDFDIDKVYVSQYSVDDNGKLISWSKMFNYSTPETLAKSLELPIPDKTFRGFDVSLDDADAVLTSKDEAAIIGYLQDKGNFTGYVDAMKKLQDAKTVFIDPTSVDIKIIQDHINSYFMSDMNTRFPKEAALNVLVSAINGASNDIRNVNSVYSPITFGAAGEAAGRSKKGAGFNTITPFNPVDVAKAKNNNMIGREVIGISASMGLKGYSALSNAFIQIMDKNKSLGIKIYNEISDYELRDGKVVKSNMRPSVGIAGINYTNSIDEYMNYYNSVLEAFAIDQSPEEIAQVRSNMVQQLRYRGDVALDLSAILSAATDNAKELILARINAGPETVTFYLTGLMYGYTFESLANLMTSNEAEAMINLASRNMFSGKQTSLTSSLSQLKAGILRPEDYFDFKTIQVIVDQLQDNDALRGKIMKSFSSNTDTSSLKAALKNPYFFFEKFIQVSDREDIDKLTIQNASDIRGDYTIERTRIKKRLSDEEAELESSLAADIADEGFGTYSQEDDGFDQYPEDAFEMDPDFMPTSRPRSKVINAEVAFNRYKEALNRYIPKGLNQDLIVDLQWFSEANKDFELLGKTLGINQSVKVTDYDLHKYFKGLIDYSNEWYTIPLTTLNDLNRFVNDSAFRTEVLESYEGKGLNVLAVLAESPHFFKMFTLAVKTDTIKNTFSAKNKLLRDITSKVLDRLNSLSLSSKVYGTIARYVDEVMIVNYLKSSGISINLNKDDYDENNEPLLAPMTITLDTISGRQAFLNWFEKNVISDLKSGKLRDVDGNYYDKPIANLRENVFIQQLTIDVKKDPMTKRNYSFYKLPINMAGGLTEDEKVLMDTITGAFATLRNYNYGGKKVLDLLYLYNLIVNKNKATGQSFNRLFDSVSEDFDNGSVMADFVKFESQLDWDDVLLQERQHYDLIDLITKGVVPVVETLPRFNPKTNTALPLYVAIDNWNDDLKETVRTIYYRINDEDYEELETNKYTEKVINISSGDNDLSDVKINNDYKIKLNRLNKLLDTMELKQLDCN